MESKEINKNIFTNIFLLRRKITFLTIGKTKGFYYSFLFFQNFIIKQKHFFAFNILVLILIKNWFHTISYIIFGY